MAGISDIRGNWKLQESNGLDDYLKHLGVSWIKRSMAKLVNPALTISSSDLKHWTITSKWTFKDHTVEFDIGAEFTYDTIDGRTMVTNFTVEGDKLVQVEKRIKPEDKESKIVRYVGADNKLHVDMESDDVKATRIFERST